MIDSAAVRQLGFALMVVLGLAACAEAPAPAAAPAPASAPTPAPAPAPVATRPPPSMVEQPTFSQAGTAAWYGTRHQGQRTASGERFDPKALTAAHPSLPFGTIARVTSIAYGGSVKVRINDRGPRTRGRIVDLSAQAASILKLRGAGIAQVKLEVFASDQ